jgi:hypothetical protein
MFYISPQVLTMISGVLSAGSGVLWFIRHRGEDFAGDIREKDMKLTVEAEAS